MSIRILILSTIVLLVSGCATGPSLGTRYTDPVPSLEGHATLYIYRQPSIGAAWYPKIFINGEEFVDLTAGGYTSVYLKPGKYEIKGIQYQPDIFRTIVGDEFNISLEVKEITDHYIKFYFEKTGNRAEIAFTGGSATSYSTPEGDFQFKHVKPDKALSELYKYGHIEAKFNSL